MPDLLSFDFDRDPDERPAPVEAQQQLARSSAESAEIVDVIPTADFAHSPAYATTAAAAIGKPSKIGIGTGDVDDKGTAAADVGELDFGWYYTWSLDALRGSSNKTTGGAMFVPMFWGKQDVTRDNRHAVEDSSAKYVLGFNEPDLAVQSDMSVGKALKLWPKLMTTDKLLGSPATTTGQTLGEDSWLGRFMDKADKRGYDVDFIAVHYYSSDDSIGAFKSFLKEVHREYDRPVWVTEWALVDWNDTDRFSLEETADFAGKAIRMMDKLDFVKRHAWFAAYDGFDAWHINTELFDSNGNLTPVGETFADFLL